MPWLLNHGLHCQNGQAKDPNFIGIGMQDLIQRRQIHSVPTGPGGMLSDYVPFYFTPYSIMMYNIKTGYNDVIQRRSEQIAILVSSIHRLVELEMPFVFTNGHAYLSESKYFDSAGDLDQVDWALLQSRDFKRDPADPGKQGRYQAEALVYRHMPVDALLGIACYDDKSQGTIAEQVKRRGLDLTVKILPNGYF